MARAWHVRGDAGITHRVTRSEPHRAVREFRRRRIRSALIRPGNPWSVWLQTLVSGQRSPNQRHNRDEHEGQSG
jgi:hypothetical protein